MLISILNVTCEECLCGVVTNSSIISIGIGSFNCFRNNKTCQLFSNEIFYEFWINNDNNTNFYIFQFPTSNQIFIFIFF
jgi:hypothetical protein